MQFFYCTVESDVTLYLSQFRGNRPSNSKDETHDRHTAFSHKFTWIMRQNYTLWHRKRCIKCRWDFTIKLREMDCLLNSNTHMVTVIFYTYKDLCFSSIKYSTTHDNCLQEFLLNICNLGSFRENRSSKILERKSRLYNHKRKVVINFIRI